MKNKGEIELHLNKFDTEVKKLFSKRNEFIKWEKYFLFVINKEIEDIKADVYDTGGSERAKSLNRRSQKTADDSVVEIVNELKGVYELKSMIRCHSTSGNPQDELTVVYDASFDPINKKICATCGGSIINFIDVTTGQVVKRFNDTKNYHSTKEVCSSYSLCIFFILFFFYSSRNSIALLGAN